ncbi:hypothetical protein FC85_GL000978 [Lentilactobacillus diolivorans DSM 14421]|uniref:Uncharacterized protein n=2 Tax=Lentilactobacillus diolivorans TaxID=179838 RepID=A0A0R1SAQ2_9LACO|nr:hypothetical protein FC85_GL000978 [Lentilactobacillus diolivorans DSM 14421]
MKEGVKMTERIFKTETYGNKMPLKIIVDSNSVFPKTAEVLAKVDTQTGEVKFFIDKENLKNIN